MQNVRREYVIREIVRRCIESGICLRFCFAALIWVRKQDRQTVYDFVVHTYNQAMSPGVMNIGNHFVGVDANEPVHFV